VTLFGIKLPKLGLWFWRRVLSWFIVVAAHVTIGWIVWASPGAAYLGNLGLGLVIEAVVVYSVYFGGSTLTQLAQFAASVAPGMKIGFGGVVAGPTPPPAPTPPSIQESSP
jgi:hypothetical protein